MKRVIYTLYIDIPEEELDFFDKNIIKKNATPTNIRTKQQLKNHYLNLVLTKKIYAEKLGIDFKIFQYDDNYKSYQQQFKSKYPFITSYNIVNFYKLHLLYKLSQKYDEILYLDFDVVPVTTDNFFDVWDLNKGIALLHNTYKVKAIEAITSQSQTIRSPTSKYYNAQAMLIEKGLDPINNVINTGIIGTNTVHLTKLNYFDNFEDEINLMTKLKSDYDIFPKKIVDFFGYDNETLFSVKLNENKVPVQWLDNQWHYFYDTQGFIPKDTKLVHAINKDFESIWRYMDA